MKGFFERVRLGLTSPWMFFYWRLEQIEGVIESFCLKKKLLFFIRKENQIIISQKKVLFEVFL